MTSSRPYKPDRYSSSAVALVECTVRVSSTLARLIRKIAEKEASGASTTDALLTTAGIQPGEVATLHKKLEQVSEEAKHWREKAAREHGQLEQSKTAAAERDKEKASFRGDLRKATDSLKGAQQEILTFEAQIAELSTTLESRNKQLAYSLSLSGVGDCAAAALRALRDRLAQGDIRFDGESIGEVEAMMANLGRPEMRTLSNMLTRRAWRIHIVRWLLRFHASEYQGRIT
jgi:rubrerythrin